jgi:amidase
MFTAHKLDAIVSPTASRRPGLIAELSGPGLTSPDAILRAMGVPGTNIANLTGFPGPVGISFLGPAFSEPRLLALGYSFEQLTRARRLPRHTPRLPGAVIATP